MEYLVKTEGNASSSKYPELSGKTDEEILALSVSYPDAFEVLVERYQAPFVRKLKSIMRAGSDGFEDIAQEAFVKMYLNAKRFRPVVGASFKSWGYKILINTCFTYLKKRNRERELTADLEPEIMDIVSAHDGGFSKRLQIDEFMATVSRLPNQVAKILLDIGVKGKTYEDIARDEKVSVSAVRTRLHRARKAFEKLSVKMM